MKEERTRKSKSSGISEKRFRKEKSPPVHLVRRWPLLSSTLFHIESFKHFCHQYWIFQCRYLRTKLFYNYFSKIFNYFIQFVRTLLEKRESQGPLTEISSIVFAKKSLTKEINLPSGDIIRTVEASFESNPLTRLVVVQNIKWNMWTLYLSKDQLRNSHFGTPLF